MSFLNEFKHNVFISYRTTDNSDGWVRELHAFLHSRLRQLLGDQESGIWRDPRLTGGELAWPTIESAIRNSAVLLSVESPGFFKSDWCPKEIRCFLESCNSKNGLHCDNLSRWLRSVKTPYDPADIPLDLNLETVSFKFYRENTQSGRFNEFSPGRKPFAEKAEDVAQTVKEILKRLKQPDHRPTNVLSLRANTPPTHVLSGAGHVKARSFPSPHVLLVDDNPKVGAAFKVEISTRVPNAIIHIAENEADAKRLIEDQAHMGVAYNIAILDIMLPRHEGDGETHRTNIEAFLRSKMKTTHVVNISGNLSSADRTHSASDYRTQILPKTHEVELQVLREVLAHLLGTEVHQLVYDIEPELSSHGVDTNDSTFIAVAAVEHRIAKAWPFLDEATQAFVKERFSVVPLDESWLVRAQRGREEKNRHEKPGL